MLITTGIWLSPLASSCSNTDPTSTVKVHTHETACKNLHSAFSVNIKFCHNQTLNYQNFNSDRQSCKWNSTICSKLTNFSFPRRNFCASRSHTEKEKNRLYRLQSRFHWSSSPVALLSSDGYIQLSHHKTYIN